MKYLAAIALSVLPLSALAGSYIVIAGQGNVPVSVTLDMPAEYVGLSVYIRSSAKDAAKRVNEVSETRSKLTKAVAANPKIEVQWVKSSFSAQEGSSYKLSSYDASSQSQLFILGKLGDSSSIDSVTKEIIATVNAVQVTGDASISTGTSSLGVLDPERFRSKLLGLIKEDVNQTKTALGGASGIEIAGIEAPVAVVQKNDRDVTPFLPYRLTLKK
jgi:hypothetical protein